MNNISLKFLAIKLTVLHVNYSYSFGLFHSRLNESCCFKCCSQITEAHVLSSYTAVIKHRSTQNIHCVYGTRIHLDVYY